MASSSSLDTPEVSRVLERLHAAAGAQKAAFVPIALGWGLDALLRRQPSVEEEARRFKDLYIPLSTETGRFAYLVARALGATRIVEFGTSFGVSTIYLAAAAKDNGGGVVIGSEIEPGKIAQARRNLDEAGLGEFADRAFKQRSCTRSEQGRPVKPLQGTQTERFQVAPLPGRPPWRGRPMLDVPPSDRSSYIVRIEAGREPMLGKPYSTGGRNRGRVTR